MGKMYTLQPDESINDHMKDSIDTINHIVELSIGCMRDLANPHEGTFIDMTYNEFMLALEHIRNTIEMLDELCDELEDDKDEIRQEYEEKVIQFFNRFMNADLTDESNYRAGELARLVHQLDNRVGELDQELEKERERSNQLEAQVKVLTAERDLAKKIAEEKSAALKIKLNSLYGIDLKVLELNAKLDKKCEEIGELTKELGRMDERIELIKADRDRYFKQLCESGYFDTDIRHMYPKTTLNNPANFCGNCKYFEIHPDDVGTCENIYGRYSKCVDPDDASCHAFESHKPDQPCCKACNRDDCDDCTLCPF